MLGKTTVLLNYSSEVAAIEKYLSIFSNFYIKVTEKILLTNN